MKELISNNNKNNNKNNKNFKKICKLYNSNEATEWSNTPPRTGLQGTIGYLEDECWVEGP